MYYKVGRTDFVDHIMGPTMLCVLPTKKYLLYKLKYGASSTRKRTVGQVFPTIEHMPNEMEQNAPSDPGLQHLWI